MLRCRATAIVYAAMLRPGAVDEVHASGEMMRQAGKRPDIVCASRQSGKPPARARPLSPKSRRAIQVRLYQ